MSKFTTTIIRLFVIIPVLQIAATAQLPQYYVKMMTDQQGLNTSDILSLAKDKQGFLWLASQSSVQRYDGKHAELFQIDETVQQVLIDVRGRKWVVARRKVFLFKNDHRGFIPVEHGPANNSTTVCLFNAAGLLYLVLSNGIQQYDEATQKFVQINNPFLKIH